MTVFKKERQVRLTLVSRWQEEGLFITCFIFRSVLASKALSHDHVGTQTIQRINCLKSYRQM